MTLFGADLSNNNWSSMSEVDAWMNEDKAEGFSWIEHKVSEGSYYQDPYWQHVQGWCAANMFPCIGYHYVTTNDPSAQANVFADNGGGAVAMLDFELNSGGIANFWNVVNAFNSRGIQVVLSYIPHWYWQGYMGSCDLTQVPGLISSSYVNGSGYASSLYPGDNGVGWNGYGGAYPIIWQYSDKALIAGKSVDVNAFRGSVNDLSALLTNTTNGAMTMADANSLGNLIQGLDANGKPLVGPDGADFRRMDYLADYGGPAPAGDPNAAGTYGAQGATSEGPNTDRSELTAVTTLTKILTRRYVNKHGQRLDLFDLAVGLYQAAAEPEVVKGPVS